MIDVHDGLKDSAKRISDAYALHKLALGDDAIGKWIACRLDDGTSDNNAYDSKRTAIRYQHSNENLYCYVQIGPWQMSPAEAERFLAVHRAMYSRGLRLTDPDTGGKDIIRRLTVNDDVSQIKAFTKGSRPTNIKHGR